MASFSQTELTAAQKTERDLFTELRSCISVSEEAYKSAITLIWDNPYGLSATGVATVLGSEGSAAFSFLQNLRDTLVAVNSGVGIVAVTGLIGDYYVDPSGTPGAITIGVDPNK